MSREEEFISIVRKLISSGIPLKGIGGKPSAITIAANRLNIPHRTARDYIYRNKEKLQIPLHDEDINLDELYMDKERIEEIDLYPDRVVPVLFMSDFQWGETVLPELVDYYNEYNIQIARQRYDQLIDKTIEQCRNLKNINMSELILLRGGDSFSGNIHDELIHTNDEGLHSCFKSLAVKEVEGINRLLGHFEKLTIISVPGNHSLSMNTRYKLYTEVNYDDLLSWYLENKFEHNKNVTFVTPRSGDAHFKIGHKQYILTHGDRIGAKGGGGIAGPVPAICRGIMNIKRQHATMGKHIDYVLMGHFHTPIVLPGGIVNGTLVGYSEYARNAMRAEPTRPCQLLILCGPETGIEHVTYLYLE